MKTRIALGAAAILLVGSIPMTGSTAGSPGGNLTTTGVVMSGYCSDEYCGAGYPTINLSFFDFYGSFVFAGKRFVGNAWTAATVSSFTAPDTVPIPRVSLTDVATNGRKLTGSCVGEMKLSAPTAMVTLTCTARVAGGPWGKKVLKLAFVQFDDSSGLPLLQPSTRASLQGAYTAL